MSDLYKTTIELVRNSGISLARIAKDADVGHRWLSGLMAGRYADPGIKKIQRLHNYLSGIKRKKAA